MKFENLRNLLFFHLENDKVSEIKQFRKFMKFAKIIKYFECSSNFFLNNNYMKASLIKYESFFNNKNNQKNG